MLVRVIQDGLHLHVVGEAAGDVEGRLAGLHRALDAGPHTLLAHAADQRPATRLKPHNTMVISWRTSFYLLIKHCPFMEKAVLLTHRLSFHGERCSTDQ